MPLKIVGYTPRWHLSPGEVVPLHVSTDFPHFHAKLVRLTGAIRNTEDWELKAVDVDVPSNCSYDGCKAQLISGSCVNIPMALESQPLAVASRFWFRRLPPQSATLAELKFATGYIRARLDVSGAITIHVQMGSQTIRFDGDLPLLLERHWYDLAIVVDHHRDRIDLVLKDMNANTVTQSTIAATIDPGSFEGFVLGGTFCVKDGHHGDLDAKVEAPRVWNPVPETHAVLVSDQAPEPLASWNLGNMDKSDRIAEVHGRYPDALLSNAPTRAVTSSSWRGQTTNFVERPDLYNAVALHADDIDDAGWPVAFELKLPKNLRSGVYCVILSERENVEYSDPSKFYPVPIFVTPGKEGSDAKIALVLPTFSYRAYANNSLYTEADDRLFKLKGPTRSGILYDYCIEKGLKSQYCSHDDGSGVHLASLKRPQVTVRPDLLSQLHSFTHQLSADLEILEWLERDSQAYVVLTDELLHELGAAVLAGYSVVMTGSHPEYSTSEQLDAYSDYNAGGGNLMYLGGNGFILRVTIDPARPWLQELRRGDGAAIWADEPGEGRHQTDGKVGGLWRNIGRPPNVTFGLGFSAMGFTGDGRYRVPSQCDLLTLPANLREVMTSIGDKLFGIAGLELDSYDAALGSSPRATVFGEIGHLPKHYVPVNEYLGELGIDPVEAVEDGVRANLIWIPAGEKGQVFATGSIRWTSGLNTEGDPTNVMAITGAVLLDMMSGAE